jgi:hypothetical protein
MAKLSGLVLDRITGCEQHRQADDETLSRCFAPTDPR